jgi:Vacuolar (H+)-ATPase G subunit.
MTSSLVSTVLEIEREAEAILTKAAEDAAKALADAKARRETDGKAYFDTIKSELKQFEEKAASERDKKVKELTASGDAALSAVRNISDAAFDNGVQYVMRALSGK